MPNHLHGLIQILPEGGVGATVSDDHGACRLVRLPDRVHWFKMKTTDDYIRGVKREGWQPCPDRVWHRNYHDRVIRDDNELDRVRHYIEQNPMNWHRDPEYSQEYPR